eukprot:TRINITY_DN5073_c0_g1_i4.p1 TRINITY_DN5073_c0_g1~~TRINITY_DN5073_c0_g1_i4.p1  ORF type:complete len:160 (-),score=10.76 TRINITY_DN5073_c0_g1_i4:57-536(-)
MYKGLLLLTIVAVTFAAHCDIEECYKKTGNRCCGSSMCVQFVDNCKYWTNQCDPSSCSTKCCMNNRCCTPGEMQAAMGWSIGFCLLCCCVIPFCTVYFCCLRSRTEGSFVAHTHLPTAPAAQYNPPPQYNQPLYNQNQPQFNQQPPTLYHSLPGAQPHY